MNQGSAYAHTGRAEEERRDIGAGALSPTDAPWAILGGRGDAYTTMRAQASVGTNLQSLITPSAFNALFLNKELAAVMITPQRHKGRGSRGLRLLSEKLMLKV